MAVEGTWDRPRHRRGALIAKWIFLVLFAVSGVVGIVWGTSSLEQYQQLVKTAVPVTATVCRIEKEEDSEGDTDYIRYISYCYEGREYTLRYDRKSSNSSKLGDVFTVRIDPRDPEIILELVRKEGGMACFFGVLGMSIAVALAGGDTRERYCKAFGISKEHIHMDLVRSIRFDIGWFAWWTGAIGFAAAIVMGADMIALFIGAILCAVVAVGATVRHFRNRRCVMAENYRVQRDQLIRKQIDEDTDSSTYSLHIQNAQAEVYTISVSKAEYEKAQPGQQTFAVYFDHLKKPYMNFISYR